MRKLCQRTCTIKTTTQRVPVLWQDGTNPRGNHGSLGGFFYLEARSFNTATSGVGSPTLLMTWDQGISQRDGNGTPPVEISTEQKWNRAGLLPQGYRLSSLYLVASRSATPCRNCTHQPQGEK